MGGLRYDKNHPWPTDGATRKYVDRKDDRMVYKFEALEKKFKRSFLRMVELETRLRELEEEMKKGRAD